MDDRTKYMLSVLITLLNGQYSGHYCEPSMHVCVFELVRPVVSCLLTCTHAMQYLNLVNMDVLWVEQTSADGRDHQSPGPDERMICA